LASIGGDGQKSTYIHNNSPSSKKNRFRVLGDVFSKWPKTGPHEIFPAKNSWFSIPPADQTSAGWAPQISPWETPQGDPLAIYQTLDRWFGNCIPHDAMNEHGIVTWVVLGGKGSNEKGHCLFQKAWKKNANKKCLSP